MSKTTIALTEATKGVLDEHKREGETYNDVVKRLAGATDGTLWTESELREIAREEITERVVTEAQR